VRQHAANLGYVSLCCAIKPQQAMGMPLAFFAYILTKENHCTVKHSH
jgi:hypothetical protein